MSAQPKNRATAKLPAIAQKAFDRMVVTNGISRLASVLDVTPTTIENLRVPNVSRGSLVSRPYVGMGPHGTPDDRLAIALDDAWTVSGIAPERILPVRRLDGSVRVERSRAVCRARRQVYLQLVAEGFAYAEIARLVGVDHTSVMHAVRRGA